MTAKKTSRERIHTQIIVPIQSLIISIIDFFYPPFRKVISLSFFRYGVSGVANMLFDWVLFATLYNFLFQKELVDLGIVVLTPHIASLAFSFPVTFFSGFLLSRYINFSGSFLRGRVQLLRYLFVVAVCLLINYVCLKIFVELLGIWPLPSKMITTVFTTLFSYFSQKHYSFKQ